MAKTKRGAPRTIISCPNCNKEITISKLYENSLSDIQECDRCGFKAGGFVFDFVGFVKAEESMN